MTRPAPLPCGTNAAYARHIVRGETIDQACRDAHRAYRRNRDHARAAVARRIREAREAAVEALIHRHQREYADLYAAALREETETVGVAP